MEKNIEKGEFLTKVEDFAKSMSEMTSEREGVKRGFVVLAVEKGQGRRWHKVHHFTCGRRAKNRRSDCRIFNP